MTTVLVTGAAGFIGSRLCCALVAEGAIVRAVDGFTDYAGVARKERAAALLAERAAVRVESVDLVEDPLEAHVAGVDTIFHLAARPGVRSSWGQEFAAYIRDNVVATQRLLEAATRAGVPRIVYASSSSVYGNAPCHPTDESVPPQPVSPYGVTKLTGEHLCAAYAAGEGPAAVALRYFTVYGPGQRPDMALHRLCSAALGGPPCPLYGDGGQIGDLTFVDDVVAATIAAAAATEATGAINVAGGTQITLAELITRVGELTGAPVPVESGPAAVGDVPRTSASIERAAHTLDWPPEVEVDAGLRRQLDWHRGAAGP